MQNQTPNVLHICLSKAEGGLEQTCANMALKFKSEGYNSFVAAKAGTFLEKKSRAMGLETVALPGGKHYSPATIRLLCQFILDHKIEVIYTHFLKDLWHLFWIKKKFPKIKLIGITHMFVDVPKKDFFHKILYSKLDHMIALTEVQKAALLKNLPVPENKYIVIPNGIDTEKFVIQKTDDPSRKALRHTLGIQNENEILVGVIGRLDRQKGQLELISAIPTIVQKFPKAKFFVLGANTIGEEDVEKIILDQISKNHLENVVKVLGFTNKVSDYMNALDIFIMPSYKETFGIVLIEAMILEKICISTNAGGPIEILDNGRCGLLIEPKSSKAIADGLSDVITNYSAFQKKAKLAHQRVLEKYDSKIVFKQLAALTAKS